MHLADRRRAREQSGHAGEIAKHVRAAGECAPPERRIAAELAAARQAEAALAYADAAAHYEAALAEAVAAPGAAPDEARRDPGVRRARSAATRRDATPGEATPQGHARQPRPTAPRSCSRSAPRTTAPAIAPPRRPRSTRSIELARASDATRCCSPARRSGAAASGVLVAATDPRDHAPARGGAGSCCPRTQRAVAARLRARLAIEFYYSDHDKAEALSAHAVADARAAGDPSALAAALNARRVALWRPERIEERLDVSTEMIEAAEAAGDRESVLQGRNWRVVDLMELGEREALDHEIAAYETLADAVGLAHYPLVRAAVARRARAARRPLGRRRSARPRRRSRSPPAPATRWRRGCARAERVHARGPRHAGPRSIATARRAGEDLGGAVVLAVRTSPISTPRPATTDRARQALRELLADGGAKLPTRPELARAGLRRRDRRDGRRPRGSRAAVRDARAARPAVPGGRPRRRLHRLRSSTPSPGLAHALGRPDEAELRLRRAITENLRIGARPRATIALARLGELLLERGETARARETLREAAAQADELDMPGVARPRPRRGARRAGRGGVSRPRSVRGEPFRVPLAELTPSGSRARAAEPRAGSTAGRPRAPGR